MLDGRRRGIRALLPFIGPGVVASIAYVDPGNFVTNTQAGAQYGYGLLWVVLLANGIAMLFQALSARLGIVTGRNLAELCRDHFPRPVVLAMWAASEVAAMATDLAEFVGGAIGLSLLFGVSLLSGMVVTAVVTYAILIAGRRGFRPLELIIGGLLLMIALSYLAELLITPIAWGAAATGALVPRLEDAGAITVAVGIIGATVMPHAIYLHSGLTQARVPVTTDAERRTVLRWSNREVVLALLVAGLVNMAMLMTAAGAFHADHSGITELGDAYATLRPVLGAGAATIFLLALIASGVSSSVVGTMAGQVIMQGFLKVRIPIWVRRLVTMVPAFAVVLAGVDATRALLVSQVVLSLVLPVPVVALVLLIRRHDIMGVFAAGRATQAAAIGATILVLVLNAVLVTQSLGIDIPGLSSG